MATTRPDPFVGMWPRPWRIEEDWTLEITAADGSIVLKLPYPSAAWRDIAERIVAAVNAPLPMHCAKCGITVSGDDLRACPEDKAEDCGLMMPPRLDVGDLIKALQPFADAAADLDDKTKDVSEIWEMPCAMQITAGDLRRAQKVVGAAHRRP